MAKKDDDLLISIGINDKALQDQLVKITNSVVKPIADSMSKGMTRALNSFTKEFKKKLEINLGDSLLKSLKKPIKLEFDTKDAENSLDQLLQKAIRVKTGIVNAEQSANSSTSSKSAVPLTKVRSDLKAAEKALVSLEKRIDTLPVRFTKTLKVTQDIRESLEQQQGNVDAARASAKSQRLPISEVLVPGSNQEKALRTLKLISAETEKINTLQAFRFQADQIKNFTKRLDEARNSNLKYDLSLEVVSEETKGLDPRIKKLAESQKFLEQRLKAGKLPLNDAIRDFKRLSTEASRLAFDIDQIKLKPFREGLSGSTNTAIRSAAEKEAAASRQDREAELVKFQIKEAENYRKEQDTLAKRINKAAKEQQKDLVNNDRIIQLSTEAESVRNLSKSLDEQIDFNVKLGLSQSKLEKATNGLRDKLVNLNFELEQLEDKYTSGNIDITKAIGKYEAFSDKIKKVEFDIKQLGTDGFRDSISELNNYSINLEQVSSDLRTFDSNLDLVESSLAKFPVEFENNKEKISELRGELKRLLDLQSQQTSEGFLLPSESLITDTEKLKKALNSLEDVVETTNESFDIFAEKDSTKQKIKDLGDTLQRTRQKISEGGIPLSEVTKQTRQFSGSLDKAQVDFEILNEEVENGNITFKEASKRLQTIEDNLNRIDHSIKNIDGQKINREFNFERADDFVKNFAFRIGILGFTLQGIGGRLTQFGSQLFNFTDRVSTLAAPLERVTNILDLQNFTLAEREKILNKLKVIGDLPGATLDSASEGFNNLRTIGLGVDDTLSLEEGLSKAVARRGGGANNLDQIINAIQKIALKSEVDNENFNTLRAEGGQDIVGILQSLNIREAADINKIGKTTFIEALIENLKELPEPARTTEDRINQLKNRLAELSVVIGKILKPGLEAVINFIDTKAKPVLDDLNKRFNDLTPSTKTFLSALVLGVPTASIGLGILSTTVGVLAFGLSGAVSIVTLLKEGILKLIVAFQRFGVISEATLNSAAGKSGLFARIGSLFTSISEGTGTVITSLRGLGNILPTILKTVGKATIILSAIIGAIEVLYENTLGIRTSLVDAFVSIQKAVLNLYDSIVNALGEKGIKSLKAIGNFLLNILSLFGKTLGVSLFVPIIAVLNTIASVIEKISDTIDSVSEVVSNFLSGNIFDGTKGLVDVFSNIVTLILDVFAGFFVRLGATFAETILRVISSAIEGVIGSGVVTNALNKTADDIKKLGSASIVRDVKNTNTEISNLSKVAGSASENVSQLALKMEEFDSILRTINKSLKDLGEKASLDIISLKLQGLKDETASYSRSIQLLDRISSNVYSKQLKRITSVSEAQQLLNQRLAQQRARVGSEANVTLENANTSAKEKIFSSIDRIRPILKEAEEKIGENSEGITPDLANKINNLKSIIKLLGDAASATNTKELEAGLRRANKLANEIKDANLNEELRRLFVEIEAEYRRATAEIEVITTESAIEQTEIVEENQQRQNEIRKQGLDDLLDNALAARELTISEKEAELELLRIQREREEITESQLRTAEVSLENLKQLTQSQLDIKRLNNEISDSIIDQNNSLTESLKKKKEILLKEIEINNKIRNSTTLANLNNELFKKSNVLFEKLTEFTGSIALNFSNIANLIGRVQLGLFLKKPTEDVNAFRIEIQDTVEQLSLLLSPDNRGYFIDSLSASFERAVSGVSDFKELLEDVRKVIIDIETQTERGVLNQAEDKKSKLVKTVLGKNVDGSIDFASILTKSLDDLTPEGFEEIKKRIFILLNKTLNNATNDIDKDSIQRSLGNLASAKTTDQLQYLVSTIFSPETLRTIVSVNKGLLEFTDVFIALAAGSSKLNENATVDEIAQYITSLATSYTEILIASLEAAKAKAALNKKEIETGLKVDQEIIIAQSKKYQEELDSEIDKLQSLRSQRNLARSAAEYAKIEGQISAFNNRKLQAEAVFQAQLEILTAKGNAAAEARIKESLKIRLNTLKEELFTELVELGLDPSEITKATGTSSPIRTPQGISPASKKAVDQTSDVSTDSDSKLTKQEELFKRLNTSLSETETGFLKIADAIQAMFDRLAAGEGVINRFKALISGGLPNTIDNLKVAFKDLAAFGIAAFSQSLGQAVADTIVNGGNFIKNLGKIFGDVLISLGSALVQMGVAALAFAALGSFFPILKQFTGGIEGVPAALTAIAAGTGLIFAGKLLGGGQTATADTSSTSATSSANTTAGNSGQATYDPASDPKLIYQKALRAQVVIDIKTDSGQIVKTFIKSINRDPRLGNLIGNRNTGIVL